MLFVKSKLTSRSLADVALVVTMIDYPKLLNILMISFLFFSILVRGKFLDIPKPPSLYNISPEVFNKSTDFAKSIHNISDSDLNTMIDARKTLFFHHEEP